MTKQQKEAHFRALNKKTRDEYQKEYAPYKGRGRYAVAAEWVLYYSVEAMTYASGLL